MLFAPNWKRDTEHLAASEPPPAQAMFARWVTDLLAAGQTDEALRRAELGTSQFPGYATGWYALARAQMASGALRAATAATEHCLALEPDFVAAWDLLADLWKRLGRPAAARAAQARRDEFTFRATESPAQTVSTTTKVRDELADAASKVVAPSSEPTEAEAQKLVLKRPPETTRAFETPTLAELYRRQGLLDRALDVYRKILARHPNDSGARAMVEKLESELSSRRKPAETS